MSPEIRAIRARYEAKKAHPNLFKYYCLTIGVPFGRFYADRWGEVYQPKMFAFVCWN